MAVLICARCGLVSPLGTVRCDCGLNFSTNVVESRPTAHEEREGEAPACPRCGRDRIHRVRFSWWGGWLGPRILSHARCDACGFGFNVKTGTDNTSGIVAYCFATLVLPAGLLLMSLYLKPDLFLKGSLRAAILVPESERGFLDRSYTMGIFRVCWGTTPYVLAAIGLMLAGVVALVLMWRSTVKGRTR